MNTPTRRDFFTYAVGATLASALPVSARNPSDPRDPKLMPLVVDLIGPMAFRLRENFVDVYLPDLNDFDEHEAGIETPVSTFALTKGDYTITGPTTHAGKPKIHATRGGTVYKVQANKDPNPAQKRYIGLTLPMPKDIVPLNPVIARIYEKEAAPDKRGSLIPYATGLRFLYEHPGAPTLTPAKGTIEFDPAPPEIELNMLIGYVPLHRHPDAKEVDQIAEDKNAQRVFNKLSELFPGVERQIEFEPVSVHRLTHFHPCKIANMLMDLMS